MNQKLLPIGQDDFRRIRESEKESYYVDKTLLIKDFLDYSNPVTLITRPRRFGKTLNMTMIRDFFDVAADSRAIFQGLAIMETDYASYINSRPVVYLSFKDCRERTLDSLLFRIGAVLLIEYEKWRSVIKEHAEGEYYDFYQVYEKLRSRSIDVNYLSISIEILLRSLARHYKMNPYIIIDEYDQPIVSSIEFGYYSDSNLFFSNFYGSALKSQEYMEQALLTGIQRVVKESVFSQLNNIKVYTVLDKKYSEYFGLTNDETNDLLAYYDLKLDKSVKEQYNGYIFGGIEIYNPWSLLYYADTGKPDNYWINTSTNFLIKKSIYEANTFFWDGFNKLISNDVAKISADLNSSIIEINNNHTIWGLLINAGYLTVINQINQYIMTVRIPNEEVKSEFVKIIAEKASISDTDLFVMFQYLFDKDINAFTDVYRKLVLDCTSYFDAKEQAYHMLFLGMCLSLSKIYKIYSNIESGYGRSDIRLESLYTIRPHIIIEFKQGENIDALKSEAINQIINNEYYTGLHGEILCIGIAHDKKRCAVECRSIKVDLN